MTETIQPRNGKQGFFLVGVQEGKKLIIRKNLPSYISTVNSDSYFLATGNGTSTNKKGVGVDKPEHF